MPTMIDDRQWTMRKISNLARKKIRLIENVKRILTQLTEEFISEEGIVKKEILSIEQYEQMKINNQRVLNNGSGALLVRDMRALVDENKLMRQLEANINALARFTRIEKEYFERAQKYDPKLH
jgi:hypothetical protein